MNRHETEAERKARILAKVIELRKLNPRREPSLAKELLQGFAMLGAFVALFVIAANWH